ncbi:MAG: cell division protein FtsL [Lachnospiraceae bacterium]|nr:cell division protein FtsL [Lachnospiraceae bacterium]
MATSAARNLNTIPVRREEKRYSVIEGKKRQRTARRISAIKTALFLAACAITVSGALTYYLMLQAEITESVKTISKMERTLNEMRLDNDENYSRITSNVNLEEVRTVAIQELGMQYAEEGQIITFNGEGSDYVRQTGKIPD